MNIEETRALRRMSRLELKDKAIAMGMRIEPDWGQPKLVSMIMKHDAGTLVEQPQDEAAQAQGGDDEVSATLTPETTDAPSEAINPMQSAKWQSSLNAQTKARNEASETDAQERMQRMAALTEQSRAMRTGESVGKIDGVSVVDGDPTRFVFKALACTCHPDDNPPVPCAQKYALSECLASVQFQNTSKFIKGLLSDADLHEMLDAWARTFVNDYERVEEDRSSDTLTVRIISRHGMTKCAVGGVVFTTSGVKEALIHLREQAEGRSNEEEVTHG